MSFFLDLAHDDVKPSKPCQVFELLQKHKNCKTIWLATFNISESVIEELNKLSSKYRIRVIAAKLPQGIKLQNLKFFCQLTPWNHAKVWGFDNHVYAGSSNLSDDTILNLMFKLNKKQAEAVANWYLKLSTFTSHESKTVIIR